MSKCIEDKCKIRASYNADGEKKGLYCSEHKKINMIDVKHLRCKYDKCYTRPIINHLFIYVINNLQFLLKTMMLLQY